MLIEFLAFILCISTHKVSLYIDWNTQLSFLANYYFMNNSWKQTASALMITQTLSMIMQTADVSFSVVNINLHFLSHNLKAYGRRLLSAFIVPKQKY